jgi:hypothetical protein
LSQTENRSRHLLTVRFAGSSEHFNRKLILPENLEKIRGSINVMITHFSDFCQFSAKKMEFYLKTNVMINYDQKLAAF